MSLLKLSPLALRHLLMAHTGSKEQSDLRQTVIWLRRFGFSADIVSEQLGFTVNEMRDHLQFVDKHHQINTTLYLGDGRYGQLFLVWAELFQNHSIKGENIEDDDVRDILLHILGLELELRHLEGFMDGWHASQATHHTRIDLALAPVLSLYLEFLLKYGYMSTNIPTTRQEFMLGWTSWQAGRTSYTPPTRVVGDDNDDAPPPS